MNIVLSSNFGSLSAGLRWDDVPSFAVLTGKNGAGKSQLLEAIGSTFGVMPNLGSFQGRGGEGPAGSIKLEGAALEPGEVFFSRSEWALQGGGAADINQVRTVTSEFARWGGIGRPPWYIEELASRAGVEPAEVSSWSGPQVEEHVTPYMLWGKDLPSTQQNLAFLFLAYRIFENAAIAKGASPDKVVERYGVPPWVTLDEILTTAGLAYSVIPPGPPAPLSMFVPETYMLRLRDTERGNDVPFDALSSGEKVIMSTAIWLFRAQSVNRVHKLLLLDEPDAHLHPSMTRRLLDVIQKVLVDRYGVRVIMTSHSPSTVALVPLANLFEMKRSGTPRVSPARSRASCHCGLDGRIRCRT